MAAQGRTLLLLHGCHTGNNWWKARSWEELSPKIPDWIREQLDVFRGLILELEAKVKALSQSISQAAPKLKPAGMGSLTHEIIDREVGDWNRFKKWRQVGSYSGLTGGVSASGQSRADLSLTKAGNKRLPAALVELAWRMIIYQPDYWLVKKWSAVLCNPKAHSRRRKQAIVAFARQLFVDLWKWKTGKATPQSLGWAMTA